MVNFSLKCAHLLYYWADIRKAVEILTNELFLFQVPRIYSEMTVNEALSENPQLFRSLGAHGIISYSEYLFLLSLLTRPKRGLRYVLKFTITHNIQYFK